MLGSSGLIEALSLEEMRASLENTLSTGALEAGVASGQGLREGSSTDANTSIPLQGCSTILESTPVALQPKRSSASTLGRLSSGCL